MNLLISGSKNIASALINKCTDYKPTRERALKILDDRHIGASLISELYGGADAGWNKSKIETALRDIVLYEKTDRKGNPILEIVRGLINKYAKSSDVSRIMNS